MLLNLKFAKLGLAAGLAATMLLSPTVSMPQQGPTEIGGDLFLSQQGPPVSAPRDAFAVGFSTSLSGDIAEDGHAIGGSVEVDATTRGDLYATGGSVSVRGPVGGDLSAMGISVRTHPSATVAQNARLAGGSVSVEGPVQGALLASGGEVYFNAAVDGDAHLAGARIRFGPNATVGGMLTYATGEEMEVPASVADASRVTFRKLDVGDLGEAGRRQWDWPERPGMDIGPAAIAGGVAATIGSFLLVGALFLAFAPTLVSRLRKSVIAQPGATALSGLIGLSMLFGGVPILAMTIIGIPLVPIAVLAILIVWFLGYVLGAYALGMKVARGLGMTEDPSMTIRLIVLAATACVAALLNFIPIIGWMANFVIVILGVGAMTYALFERTMPSATVGDIP